MSTHTFHRMRCAKPLSLGLLESLEPRQLLSADLHAALGTSTLPTTLTSGFGTTGKIQVIISNDGDIATASTEKVRIQLFARAVSDSTDSLLATFDNQSLPNLAPTKSKTFTLTAGVPISVATGEYNLVVIVTDLGPSSDTNAENDTAVGPTLNITQGVLNLQASLGAGTKLPATTISGNGSTIPLQITVSNTGTVNAAKTEKITIDIVARPSAGPDVHLTTLANQAIAGLKPNASKSFNAKVSLPIDLTTGDWTIVVTVTDTGPTTETDSGNNAATSATIPVTQGFIDLAPTFAKNTIPATIIVGTPTNGTVQVQFTNNGNITTPKTQTLDFSLTLHPHAGGDDIVLKSIVGQVVGNMKAGQFKLITVPVALSGTLSIDSYDIVAAAANITPSADADNNTVTSTFAITAAPPILGDMPSTIHFTQTQIIVVPPPIRLTTENGSPSFAGQTNNGDTYTFIVNGSAPKIGSLALGITPFGPVSIRLTFNSASPTSLNGKTITFKSSSAGTTGKFETFQAYVNAGIPGPTTGFFVLS